ncbi:hypothetical protein [Marinococcus luteus]|uniref:hypothetical protein n=1 Tax=Marinococcus luteus TaxID=1122204 RepID=UPI002ACC91CC|nr:hypothetical protein [Marinococcus luteus]MDZ5784610.1 hypothetical protein [Marinococcus luteus]
MTRGIYFDCEVPNYCTHCGNKLWPIMDEYHQRKFAEQLSFSCNDCGTANISIKEEENLSRNIKKELNKHR